jgi:phi13 family phage major tail protein
MATIGLRDLYGAPITTSNTGAEIYGTPFRLAKAISAELSVEVAEAILYADDSIDEVAREFTKGELKLNVSDFLPEHTAMLLGQTQDADGVLFAGENDEPPYLAIGFRAKKTGGLYRYLWLYKVQFAIPGEKYETKADGISFSTPEITGTIVKRDDGLWKADYVGPPESAVAQGWFTGVREKATEQTEEPG